MQNICFNFQAQACTGLFIQVELGAYKQLIIFYTKLVMKKIKAHQVLYYKTLSIINNNSIIGNEILNFIWILTIMNDFI